MLNGPGLHPSATRARAGASPLRLPPSLTPPPPGAHLGHIVLHLVQVSVLQGPHELLVAHPCSGAGRTRRGGGGGDGGGGGGRRITAGFARETGPRRRCRRRRRPDAAACQAGRGARGEARRSWSKGEEKFFRGPGRTPSRFRLAELKLELACTSGSRPAKTRPRLPLPLLPTAAGRPAQFATPPCGWLAPALRRGSRCAQAQ